MVALDPLITLERISCLEFRINELEERIAELKK